MEIAIAASVLLMVGGLLVGLKVLSRADEALRVEVEKLTATVAKMQADARVSQRPANAPPIGAFSFKGGAK